MEYLCPKCGNFMQFIKIPMKNYYICCCGYRSKYLTDDELLSMLPKKLWLDKEDENGFNNV